MDQLKGSTGESLSTQQQPQLQQQQQSKKKSKNKKKSSRTELTAAAAATTTTTLSTVAVKDVVGVSADSCDVQGGAGVAVNGLTDQLKQQLQMGDEDSSSNMAKVNGLVTEKHLKTSAACPNTSTTTDSLPQTSSAKVVLPTPAINGHHPDEQRSATAQAAIKKSKRKPNNKKNPPPHTEHLPATNENGHCPAQATLVTQPQLGAVDDKEHLLHNGYNHHENKQVDNKQTALGQTNNAASIAKSQVNSQEIENKTAMASECPAKEQIATKPQQEEKDSKKSIVAAEETPVENPTLDLEHAHIEYKEYESELQMHDIMRLIQAELSEPYSIYTYRYFIYNWPKLCFLAAHGNEYVGAIVCKLDMHMNVRRGYIAMLAVRKEYRKLKIGTTLVQKAIEAMLADKADEVVLETEMSNLPALRLYENLGFVRDKRLFRYYLNGVDALRLKLWFR